MPAAFIESDATKIVPGLIKRGLEQVKEGRATLAKARAIMIQQRNGDGSLASHYDLAASKGGYIANDYSTAGAAAKKSFEELDTLHVKLNQPSGQGDATGAAIDGCSAIHGV